MRRGEAAVAAARACLGAKFRPQGRDVDHGLDCVGVAALAYGIAAPAGYALRGGRAAAVAARIVAAGFMTVTATVTVTAAEAGDLLLIAAGPEQLHLGIWTGDSLVQAHAGLRRVVETPGRPAGAVVAIFRPAGAADRQED